MHARLVGGPYDGDEGELLHDPPTPMLWVGPCLGRDCFCEGEDPNAPHWFVKRLEDTVRYALVTMDERGACYEYGDALDGLNVTRARDREPVLA